MTILKNITATVLLLLSLFAYYLSGGFEKTLGQKVTTGIADGNWQKIQVLHIINPSLSGNENGFIDEQQSNIQVNGKSDASSTPAMCETWWAKLKDTKLHCVEPDDHPMRVGNVSIINYDFEFDGMYQLKKICVFVHPKNRSKTSNQLSIRTGTPFHFEKNLATLTDDGSLGSAKWIDIDCDEKTQFVQISLGNNFAAIGEIVFYGTRISKTVLEIPAYHFKPASFDNMIGTNIVFQMGQSADGRNYDEDWTGGLRWFAAVTYVMDKNGNLKHPSGTANDLEEIFNRRILASGSKLHYAFGSLVDSGMVSEKFNSGGDWSAQKPIPASYITDATTDTYENILTLNEIAENPAVYARVANNLKKLSAGLYSIGHRYIEPDNERDGFFKRAGCMLPYQLAAYVSCLYDGHDNSVLYNGEKTGFKNNGTPTDSMKFIFPALTYVNPTYIRAMWWWWKYNRKNGKVPFDIFNFHAYPSTLETGTHYRNAQAIMPENVAYNLEKKLDTIRYFAALFHTPVINTETGYDMYEEYLKKPNQWCDSTARWGNSFVGIRPFASKSTEEIGGEWLLRNFLIHNSKSIPVYQFWLADQEQAGTTCGTFHASGFLKFDTVINWKQQYIPRAGWYYVQCFKKRLKGFIFQSQEKSGNLIIQQYLHPAGKKALVVWRASDTGQREIYHSKLPSNNGYIIITPNKTEFGNVATRQGNSVELLATELPQIILY